MMVKTIIMTMAIIMMVFLMILRIMGMVMVMAIVTRKGIPAVCPPENGCSIVGRNALTVSCPDGVDVRRSGGVIAGSHVNHRVEGGSRKGSTKWVMLAVQPSLQTWRRTRIITAEWFALAFSAWPRVMLANLSIV